jgi:hypothetical protein
MPLLAAFHEPGLKILLIQECSVAFNKAFSDNTRPGARNKASSYSVSHCVAAMFCMQGITILALDQWCAFLGEDKTLYVANRGIHFEDRRNIRSRGSRRLSASLFKHRRLLHLCI